MPSDSDSGRSRVIDARKLSGEPFDIIMNALDDLETGDTLLLINSFEPKPLYDVIAERGYAYETNMIDDDEWHVEITPDR
jgi:uncharacterized protein (DUF2249 family)